MKIGISAMEASLDADMDPRFGRCRYFIIVDPESMQFEAIENSSATAPGGAGIATAQMVASKGVEAVLTGNCGPNAHQVLLAAGIKVMTGASGKVQDVIKSFNSGHFEASSQPTVAPHFGKGMGRGRGMGMGMGRRMGGGGSI